MIRRRALELTIAALILTALACNAFAGSRQPILGPPPTSIPENNGIGADESSELAATATLSVEGQGLPAKATMLVDLNVRSGPGVQYDRVGFLLEGDEVPILGRHQESGWWMIECPDNVPEGQCWVSGGEQYTRAESVEFVAAVEAPPTPTPVPPEIEEGTGILSYISDGFIYALALDLRQEPARLVSEPVLLTDIGDVQALAISPDGRRIAFVAGTSQANSLYVVNVDGQDQRRLVSTEELPLSADQNPADFAVLVSQISWLSDSKTLLFNSSVTALVGLGGGSQEDLWSVNIDGDLQELLPSGEGGGAFVLTTNNQILLSRSNNIARANIDGSGIEITLQFDPINTASETIYYPIPQILDGQVNVAIPAADPFSPDEKTTIWRIPSQGPAGQLGALSGASFFDPILWSFDGNRLAFIQQDTNPDAPQPSRLVIADGKGINPDGYAAGDRLVFHAWSIDNTSFLYSGTGFYTVGKLGGPPVQTLLGPGLWVNDAQWLTSSTFVAAVGDLESGSWELLGADLTGANIPLAEIRGTPAIFDLWPEP